MWCLLKRISSDLVLPSLVRCKVHTRWMLKATELQDEYFTFIFWGKNSRASIRAQLFHCLPHLLCALCLRELKFPFLRHFWVRPFTGFSISLSPFYYNDILIIIIVGITLRVYKAMACGYIIHSIYTTIHL